LPLGPLRRHACQWRPERRQGRLAAGRDGEVGDPVTTPDEQAQARLILGLLLDGDRVGVERIDWDTLLPLARNNGVLIRIAERLAEQGIAPPAAFAESVARERQRARDAFTLVRQVSRICVTHGIQFLFAKVCQHYPDLGDYLHLTALAS